MKYRSSVLAAVCLAVGVLILEPVKAATDIAGLCPLGGGMWKGWKYNTFSKLSKNVQQHGIDSWLLGYVAAVPRFDCAKRISICIDKTTRSQRHEMVKRVAEREPEQWNVDHDSSRLIHEGFVLPCLKGTIPIK